MMSDLKHAAIILKTLSAYVHSEIYNSLTYHKLFENQEGEEEELKVIYSIYETIWNTFSEDSLRENYPDLVSPSQFKQDVEEEREDWIKYFKPLFDKYNK
jgi:hypothetical protein